MLKGFGNFLLKELKELVRDPKILLGMIIVPLIMFPVLGAVMGYAVQSAQEKAVKATLVVVNNDGGEWSHAFISFLQKAGVNVLVENNTALENGKVLGLVNKYNTTQILEIPKGFSENVTAHLSNPSVKASLKFYGVFLGTGVFESVSSSVVDALVSQFNRAIAPDVLYTEKSAIVKGEIKHGVDPAVLSGLMMSQSIALPITIMILLTYSVQIAATSVAVEKEEKTLETLLTMPMDRLAILLGKLSSSIVVAAVGAIAYMAGYGYLMGSVLSGIPANINVDLASLGLAPSFLGYILLGLSLFVTMLSALALAVILSAFAEDVRSAQSFVGYIYPFIFLPAFALMYIDINTLPYAIRLILYAIPYSHPVIASRAVTMGDHLTAVVGIVYVSLFTVIVMYAASRLFATEKILTAKLKFKGLKKRGEKPAEEL
ncbi:MAG: ABC transporter permease [Nitrososphaerota archaeon]|nr:ABC transporter permease [Nitrososphaerota archaeon]